MHPISFLRWEEILLHSNNSRVLFRVTSNIDPAWCSHRRTIYSLYRSKISNRRKGSHNPLLCILICTTKGSRLINHSSLNQIYIHNKCSRRIIQQWAKLILIRWMLLRIISTNTNSISHSPQWCLINQAAVEVIMISILTKRNPRTPDLFNHDSSTISHYLNSSNTYNRWVFNSSTMAGVLSHLHSLPLNRSSPHNSWSNSKRGIQSKIIL